MPKGRKSQKRPSVVTDNSVKDARIAMAEEAEGEVDDGKDPAAKSLGRRGGNARAVALSSKRRVEIARQAAAKRWEKR